MVYACMLQGQRDMAMDCCCARRGARPEAPMPPPCGALRGATGCHRREAEADTSACSLAVQRTCNGASWDARRCEYRAIGCCNGLPARREAASGMEPSVARSGRGSSAPPGRPEPGPGPVPEDPMRCQWTGMPTWLLEADPTVRHAPATSDDVVSVGSSLPVLLGGCCCFRWGGACTRAWPGAGRVGDPAWASDPAPRRLLGRGLLQLPPLPLRPRPSAGRCRSNDVRLFMYRLQSSAERRVVCGALALLERHTTPARGEVAGPLPASASIPCIAEVNCGCVSRCAKALVASALFSCWTESRRLSLLRRRLDWVRMTGWSSVGEPAAAPAASALPPPPSQPCSGMSACTLAAHLALLELPGAAVGDAAPGNAPRVGRLETMGGRAQRWPFGRCRAAPPAPVPAGSSWLCCSAAAVASPPDHLSSSSKHGGTRTMPAMAACSTLGLPHHHDRQAVMRYGTMHSTPYPCACMQPPCSHATDKCSIRQGAAASSGSYWQHRPCCFGPQPTSRLRCPCPPPPTCALQP